MIFHILKYWCSFIVPLFYKRIQAQGLHHIKRKVPMIIAMNHPNAFTDPILLTYLSYPHRLRYLARGDAFKPGLGEYLLERIGLVPIFRLQDAGKEGLRRNDETYRKVNELLKKKGRVIVFAEGLCIQERRLRPLKKGVARMVFGAYEATGNDELIVVPVGVNYSDPDKFRSEAFFNVGEPIKVRDYMDEYKLNPARTYNIFLQDLEPKMRELITHIEDPANDELVYGAEILLKDSLLHDRGKSSKDLAAGYEVLKELTEKINAQSKTNPPMITALRHEVKEYFESLQKLNVYDYVIKHRYPPAIDFALIVARVVLLIAAAPLYLAGLICNVWPLLLTDKITRKLVREKEFYSSFALGIGMALFFLFYLALFIFAAIALKHIFLAFVVCIFSGLCGGFVLVYHPFLINTIRIWRGIRHQKGIQELSQKRQKIIAVINKF
jgi:glycerol-3-phosphate O-acyltransferase / dihydroxyacetone phosphate acyltransferase